VSRCWAGLLATLALCGGGGAAASERGAVADVRHWSYGAYTRVVVELSQPATTVVHEIPADPAAGTPARLYFDLPGIWVGRTRDEPIPIDDGLLRRVRIGQHTREAARVVLDVERWDRYRLLRLAGPERVVLDVFGARQPVASDREPAASRVLPMQLRPLQRIVLDPGHGGRDPGAIGRGRLQEKDVTLRLARALRRELAARGFSVVLTREDDRTLSLLERTAIAEGAGGDLFVSLHANAARNRRAEGVEIYTLDENARRQTLRLAARENGVTPGEVNALQNLLTQLRVSETSQRADRVADLVFEEIVRGMARRWPSVSAGRGRLRGPFYVLYLSDMPSILIEAGFVTHAQDARRLRDPDYLETLAARIASGIERFREGSAPVVAERSR
jgi:N-acetylmuramoyl-L-alanine amidase